MIRGLAARRRACLEDCRRTVVCLRRGPQPYRPVVEVLEDRVLLTFIAAPTYTVGSHPDAVAVGDFNGDGHLDLAVANDTRAGTVSILLNKGDGTFQSAQDYAVGSDPDSLAVGDFNGDGHLDLAVANPSRRGPLLRRRRSRRRGTRRRCSIRRARRGGRDGRRR